MLRFVRLVDQFNELERGAGEQWSELRLELGVTDGTRLERATALLGPANPGRRGQKIRFAAVRSGRGVAPEAARRLLRRLDDEGVRGDLELLHVESAPERVLRKRDTLRAQWERALASVPTDWSDIYAEIRLESTDYVERAALLLAPVNPARYGGAATLRFRGAHHFGYGVSPEMAGRCLQRCDDEGITGTVEILRVLCDANPVGTQGPVWLVGGRVV
jgi:hypothetical protein